ARPRVAGEAALADPEVAAVHDAAPVAAAHRGDGLVEHFVEHDQLDEVAGHPFVVERGVYPDQLLVVQVHAHLDRSPSPPRAPAAPPDPRYQPAVEVVRVEVREDLAQVVDPAPLGQVMLWPLRDRADQVPVPAD